MEKFGIVVHLPQCSFEAEILRDTISDTVAYIDKYWTENGVDTDLETRMSRSWESVIATANTILTGTCKSSDEAITDIAYGFIYAYSKQHGMANLIELRGLIGMTEDQKLIFHGCHDSLSFIELGTKLRSTSVDEQSTDYTQQHRRTIH